MNEEAVRDLMSRAGVSDKVIDVLLRGLRAEWKEQDEKAEECDHWFFAGDKHCHNCAMSYADYVKTV